MSVTERDPPPPMDVEPAGEFRLRDRAAYEAWKVKQQGEGAGYGLACFSYAERWARKLQHVIDGAPATPVDVIVREHADRLSHDADVEGVTGFMYGMAVSILAQCWEHGEALRRWHNG